jgi:hypothetical protein
LHLEQVTITSSKPTCPHISHGSICKRNIQTTLASTADPKNFFGEVKKYFLLFFILGTSIKNYGF